MLSKIRRSTADAAKVESSILLARLGDALGAVPLRQRDHGVAVLLEERHIGVHAACGCRAEAAARVSIRSLGRPGVVDHVGTHVVGQVPLLLEALCQLRVRYVTRNDDGACQRQPCLDGVLCQHVQDVLHRLVQVDLHGVATQAGHRPGLLQEAARVPLQLLDEHTVVGDLCENLAIRTAGDPNADGARGSMPGHPNDPDVMDEVLASELRTDPQAMAHREDLLLPLGVSVRTSMVVSCLRKVVEVPRRRELHRLQAELRRETADDDGQMVWGARGRAQGHDLLSNEGFQGLWVQQGLRLLVQVGLVGRATALGHEHELVLVAPGRIDLQLCGQIALRVLLGEHSDRRDLGVAQVPLGVSIVNAVRQVFLVLPVSPDEHAPFAHADGGACVLATREHTLRGNDSVLQQVVCGEPVIV
mmetsp:Transcript_98253/g.273296  ORF Transcript_98253/g.273296 Transcript_98253/m.273296 type:complete len:417 (+) Transcript_98253:294-1544(+)